MQSQALPQASPKVAQTPKNPMGIDESCTVDAIYEAYASYFAATQRPQSPSLSRPPSDAFYSADRHGQTKGLAAPMQKTLPRSSHHKDLYAFMLGPSMTPSPPASPRHHGAELAEAAPAPSAPGPNPKRPSMSPQTKARPLPQAASPKATSAEFSLPRSGQNSPVPTPHIVPAKDVLSPPPPSALQANIEHVLALVPERKSFVKDHVQAVLTDLSALRTLSAAIARGPWAQVPQAVTEANKTGLRIDQALARLQQQVHQHGMFLVLRGVVPHARDALVDHMRAVLHRLRQKEESERPAPLAGFMKIWGARGLSLTLAHTAIDVPLALHAMQRFENAPLDPPVIFQLCQFYREIARLANQAPSPHGLTGALTTSPLAVGKTWHDHGQYLWDLYQNYQRQGPIASARV